MLRFAICAAAAAITLGAAPASATIMLATITGTVSEGFDSQDVFGLGPAFSGQAFTAVFRYDTTRGADHGLGAHFETRASADAASVGPVLSAVFSLNGVDYAAPIALTYVWTFAAEHFAPSPFGFFAIGTDRFDSGPESSFGFSGLTQAPGRLDVPFAGALTEEFDPHGTGGLTLGGGPDGLRLTLAPTRISVTRAAVPEPGAWLFLITGFAAAGTALRVRRQASRPPLAS